MTKTASKAAAAQPEHINLPIGRRDASVDSATLDKEQRTFEVVWTKGADVKRGYYEQWIEQLDVSPEAVRMDRFNSGRAPVLDTHNSWELKNIIGVIEKAWIKDGEGRAKIRLSSRDDISGIVSDIADGIIGNISCGYIVHAMVEETKEGVKYRRATDWEPVEISFVPVPADPDAGMRSAPQGAVHPCIITRATPAITEVLMDRNDPAAVTQPAATTTTQPDPATQERAQQTQTAPQTAQVTTDARAHAWPAADIQKLQARAAAFGLGADVAIEILGDANVRTLEAATDALQTRIAAKNAPRQVPQVQVTRDEGDTIRTAVEAAIVLRANPQGLKADAPERQAARNYRGMSLLEMGRVFLEETQGRKLRGQTRMELATVLLGLDTRSAGGMHSTSDFANLLANVASKRLRAAYEAAPQNWKRIARQSNNPDFKEKSVVQLSSAPSFKRVREGDEYSYGALTEGVEKYALATYGRIIAITRQTLINDDLSAFDRLPTLLGRAAAELEASTFWSIFTSNPAMNDTIALFHADHGNLGSASAINEAGLTAGKAAMRKQKSLAAKAADREPLNLVPKFLIVSPDKEVEAQKMLTAVTPNAASGVNVFQSSQELIVEARLTGNAWYQAADPATIDTIEYSYLEGEEGVYVEERVGFKVDEIEIKGRLDFAAKAIDHRGLYKNPGA